MSLKCFHLYEKKLINVCVKSDTGLLTFAVLFH
jgi:hypothetical protein